MKKKGIVRLVYSIFLVTLLSFAVHFLKEDDKPKVFVVLKRLDVEYWRAFESGAQKAFDDFDIDGKVIAPEAVYPIINQPNLLKSVLKQNPDALIISPAHPSVTIPVLKQYKKRNIPILFVNRDAEWKDKTAYIGIDHSLLGKKAGELLGSTLQPGDQVAVIYGNLRDQAELDRIKGAREVLGNARIKIVTEQLGEDRFENPVPVMERILQDYPNIKGVFATSDRIALDTLKVIEEKELKIPVIGTEGSRKMVKAIESGVVSATIGQNPYDVGYLSVEQAQKAIKGEYVEKRIDIGVDIVTKDNGKERLDFLNQILHSRVERLNNFMREF
ncbi:sugar ABC transporter substrate-binding protein [Priestia abyssalis]|uniref:sugar ABC transporter substrate-binding protein n=1 Tax=Priestia abyssalis TaxID=1221450 RepID=UPI001475CF15|nr:sugar ABC transporter substrate-binding protein [Priestia abyssalis]